MNYSSRNRSFSTCISLVDTAMVSFSAPKFYAVSYPPLVALIQRRKASRMFPLPPSPSLNVFCPFTASWARQWPFLLPNSQPPSELKFRTPKPHLYQCQTLYQKHPLVSMRHQCRRHPISWLRLSFQSMAAATTLCWRSSENSSLCLIPSSLQSGFVLPRGTF